MPKVDSIVEVLAVRFVKGRYEDAAALQDEEWVWEPVNGASGLWFSVDEMLHKNVPEGDRDLFRLVKPEDLVMFNRDLIGFRFTAVGTSNDAEVCSGVGYDARENGWGDIVEPHIELITKWAKEELPWQNKSLDGRKLPPGVQRTKDKQIHEVRFLTAWNYWSHMTPSSPNGPEEWDAGTDLIGRFDIQDINKIIREETGKND